MYSVTTKCEIGVCCPYFLRVQAQSPSRHFRAEDERRDPPVRRKPGVRSPTPSFDHATIGHPGEILIQPSTESSPERARQVDPRASVVAERVDEGFSDEAGVLDCSVLRARDIRKRVREDFVPRLLAREGCEEDWREEDDRDDPPVSIGPNRHAVLLGRVLFLTQLPP